VPYRKVKEHPINSETYSSIRNEIDEDHIRQIYERYFWAIAESLGRLQKQVGSFLFLFVGRSSLRGRPVPIDQILAEHFSDMGWVHEETLVDTIVARRMFSYQVNPATKIKDSRTATEHLVVLRRP
ncbi:MAG: hypothetical protein ACE5IO_10755, partial [Thermoplasmata archaeon]